MGLNVVTRKVSTINDLTNGRDENEIRVGEGGEKEKW